jgi:hypothetical protein
MKKSILFLSIIALCSNFMTAQVISSNGSLNMPNFWNNSYPASLNVSNIYSYKGLGFYFGENQPKSDDWGLYGWGMHLNDASKFKLTGESANEANGSLALSCFYGVFFKTYLGTVAIHQNGVMTIGIDDKILLQKISNGSPSERPYKLYVGSGIRTESVKVDLTASWPDYVFANNFQRMTLPQIEAFINQNKHLPNTPSAETVKKDGLVLEAAAINQQEKIEDIYLHLIELEKRLKVVEAENIALKAELVKLKK